MAAPAVTVTDLLCEAVEEFQKKFHCVPEKAGCAPGRVNLIGDHTDYNEGFVLPMALQYVTIVVGRRNGSDACRVLTTHPQADEPCLVVFDVPALKPGLPKWANYVKGIVANFIGTVPGFDAVIASSVPVGGGVSSSASLEVATYTFLEAIAGQLAPNPTDKALACQKAEHDFPGMPCGIMDQFISVLAQEGHALLIDCRSLEYTAVPMRGIVTLLTNSNVKHELTGSEYSTRRKQCQEAANLLGRKSLRDANFTDLERLAAMGAEEAIVKRTRHVIGENRRTQEAVAALKESNFIKFGMLMVESHRSLRYDYEVSCPELDELVDIAMGVEGVLGSRMTGGGFGGCTVTLVHRSAVDKLIAAIQSQYKGSPVFHIASPGDGARILSLKN